jgi:selenide, water dikinase
VQSLPESRNRAFALCATIAAMKRLVLVGGGHAHVEVLRRFARSPVPGVEVTLINASRHTVYSGMLPGLVAGHYGWRACHIDLAVLARLARARLLRDIATGIDLERKSVHCADGAEVAYDIASIDVGSVSSTHGMQQASRNGLSIRPVERFLMAWDRLVHEAGAQALNIAIVGAGVGGVELCLAMQHRLRQRAQQNPVLFTVVGASAEILPDHPASVRTRFENLLRDRGVSVRSGACVVGADEEGLLLEGGQRLRADRVVWVTGPASPRWLGESGLRTDASGFVLTDDCFRSLSHPEVFAAGDAATAVNRAWPKSATHAVRQGAPLADNLRLILRGHPPRTFEPHLGAPQLIGTGDRHAIASWGPLSVQGAWVWRWKNWSDRHFMARYAAAG